MFLMTKAVSGKKHIDRFNTERAMHKYTVKYCRALHKLYDMGFTPSPFSIDDIDFRVAVQQEFPDELRLLHSPLSGRTVFNKKTLLYAEYATENNEFREVARAYRELLTAKEELYKCEKILTEVPFRLRGSAYFLVKVVVSEGILDVSKYPVVPEALLSDGYKFVWEYNIGGAILYTMCKEIGISDDTIREYKEHNKPFFTEGVTGTQEESLADIILHGNIPIDGDFGEALKTAMVNYYNKYFMVNNQTSSDQLSFESYIYNKSVDAYCSIFNDIRDKMAKNDLKELYVTSDKVYLQGKTPQYPVDTEEYYRDLTVGTYTNLPTVDIFEGVQGNFNKDGDGVPMYLTDLGLVYSEPFDEFRESDKNSIYKSKCMHDDHDMLFYIERMCSDKLTQELAMALFLARCGKTEYTLHGDYLRSNVDAFRNCSAEAVHLARDKFNLL